MFLLNNLNTVNTKLASAFTSHYVPIKSNRCDYKAAKLFNFTSHYVPIKSLSVDINRPATIDFTSHYVPIKSQDSVK